MTSRRALLRHVWTMVQTRAEAAALVVSLQRTALVESLVMFGVAAVTGLATLTALIVLVAVVTPERWRWLALLGVTLALVAATVVAAAAGRRKLQRDRGTIADFKRGLKLDMALVNLALRDPDTDDADKLEAREQAREQVREAAVEKAANSGDGPGAAVTGSDSAEDALRAVSPTEREMPPAAPLDAADAGPVPPASPRQAADEGTEATHPAGRAA
jgi:uncharacterized membrane protein YqjE